MAYSPRAGVRVSSGQRSYNDARVMFSSPPHTYNLDLNSTGYKCSGQKQKCEPDVFTFISWFLTWDIGEEHLLQLLCQRLFDSEG
ncbi:hypothetical protein STEG23_004736 [Scotinomys teguina]